VQTARIMERGGLVHHGIAPHATTDQSPRDRTGLPGLPSPSKDQAPGLAKSSIVWSLLILPPPPAVASEERQRRVPWQEVECGPRRDAPPSPPPRAA
jgi:hypothetical protein